MQRILILGGGVGGTLTANLLVKKLRAPDRPRRGRGASSSTRPASTSTSPGFMYIAMGGERAENLQRPERSPPRQAGDARRRRGRQGRRGAPGRHPDRRPAARLRLPGPGDRLADRARGDRALRHRGPPLLHRRGRGQAARRARRVRRRPDRHRHRRDALQVPAGAARGGVPHRVRAARPRLARPSDDRLLLADRARVHDRERVRHGDADPRGEGHRAAHVLQRRGDRPRPQGRRRASRARSSRTTCSSSSRRTRASSS